MHKLRPILLTLLLCLMIPAAAQAAAFRLGDAGQDVKEIQQALVNAGYAVDVDGAFGPATREAVIRFQRDHGLEADGLVGERSYQALLHRSLPAVIHPAPASAPISSSGIAGLARQYLGVPYVWGGASPSGFDCSGFVQYVYAQYGIRLPRTADVQASVGYPVSREELQPGDLVFFAGDYVNISHVGIYVGGGQMIHASSTYGIAYDSLSRDYRVAHYAGARRVS